MAAAELSRGADVAAGELSRGADVAAGETSPGADVAGLCRAIPPFRTPSASPKQCTPLQPNPGAAQPGGMVGAGWGRAGSAGVSGRSPAGIPGTNLVSPNDLVIRIGRQVAPFRPSCRKPGAAWARACAMWRAVCVSAMGHSKPGLRSAHRQALADNVSQHIAPRPTMLHHVVLRCDASFSRCLAISCPSRVSGGRWHL